jgi:hypothetical protein
MCLAAASLYRLVRARWFEARPRRGPRQGIDVGSKGDARASTLDPTRPAYA